MIKTISAFIITALLTCTSCKMNGNRKSTSTNTANPAAKEITPPEQTEEIPDTSNMHVDSFKIVIDSLFKANIKLPPIYAYDVLTANSQSVKTYTQMAKACKGEMKILVNSKMLSKEIINTVKEASVPNSDLLLLIDHTYSMWDDIANVKAGIGQIIDSIKKYRGIRLAVAFYGDKNYDGMDWYQFRNFENHYDEAAKYINAVTLITGGDDFPESAYDAFFKSCDEDFWRSTKKRNIILIGDAPPLEKPKSNYSVEEVIAKAHEHKILMNFYPIVIMPDVYDVKMPASEVKTYGEIHLITSIYPNPSTGLINVGFEESDTYHLEIYNSSGEAVLRDEFFGLSWSRDLDNMPNGMYILRAIRADHKYEVMKFILKH